MDRRKDEVIIIEGNDANETPIKGDVLNKVVNKSAFRRCPNDGQITIGVRLKFTQIVRSEKRCFLLTKEIICRKDVEQLVFLRENKKVQFVDSRTNKPRTISDEFDDISKLIISKNFIDFFFIEGEQLGQLTPLEGNQLQSTINSIVYLDVLDHMVLKSCSLFNKSDQLYDEVLKEDKSLSADLQRAITNIQELKKEILDIKESIDEHEKEKELNQKIVTVYRKKAENSAKKKKLLLHHDVLKQKVEIAETRKESHIRAYLSNLMSQ